MTFPRIVIGCSLFALVLSGAVGVFNLQQTRCAWNPWPDLTKCCLASNQPQNPHLFESKRRAQGEPDPQIVEIRGKLECAETELVSAQTERKALEAASCEKEERIAQLERQIRSTASEPTVIGPADHTQITELQAQLEDAKKQVDAAEQEKRLLADKIRIAQERSAKPKPKNRSAASGNPGIRGRILAVNHVYNFVVLDLGGRQGVEPNSEMLVMRGTTFIGKIRVSSVEPATTIGDIITTSLARGVQVQPGDTVVYAGTNF